jgi:hypothetical protein
MSTLTIASQLTLVELAKRTFNGDILNVAEVMTKRNDILKEMLWIAANGDNNHVFTKRVSLPGGNWRDFNEGVDLEASQTEQGEEPIKLLNSFSEIDVEYLKRFPDRQKARRSEDAAFIEGLGQTLASAFFYGNNVVNRKSILGLSNRSAWNDNDNDNCITAGGSGDDVTSLWIIQWGEDAVHMVYPKNAQIGLEVKYHGEYVTSPASGKKLTVDGVEFVINAGIVIHDDRCVQRICNIEQTGSTNILDDDYIIKALGKMPDPSRAVIYCNRNIMTQFNILAKDKTNVHYGEKDPWGKRVTMFQDSPIRLCEALTDETAIS